jgi:hypothetical protein
MRMGMRRFTRLTNAFSRKVENLAHAVSLHYMHYNFCRPHKTVSRGTYPTTPAMAAGVADHELLHVLLPALSGHSMTRSPVARRAMVSEVDAMSERRSSVR